MENHTSFGHEKNTHNCYWRWKTFLRASLPSRISN
jgi:hypothetical protein